MGTNDYGHETPMGTIDDMEDISFYGALNVIIPGIQKEVCEKYDVPVIDLFTLSGMDPSLSEVRTQYMPDGLHPNAAGHERIAAIIAKSLEGILVGK